jgi:Large polyvalent protein associated domain 23/ADP-Ribosyltransferase in polyvalent proteins
MDRNLLLGDLLDQFSNYTNGMRLPGNIDLNRRPVVRNPDGSISTVASTSIGTDRGEILIPMVAADGSRVLSQEGAEEQFFKTGQHLGIFKTPEHANAYANSLHEQHARQYAPGDPTTTADILQAQEEESHRRLTHWPQAPNPYMQGIEDRGNRWWTGVVDRTGQVASGIANFPEELEQLFDPEYMATIRKPTFDTEMEVALNWLSGAPGIVGMFGGVGAKSANYANLRLAEQLEKQGISRDEIWKQTGWGRFVDGQWRFEIPDNTSRLLTPQSRGKGFSTAERALSHPELFENYPHLKDLSTQWGTGGPVTGSQGAYSLSAGGDEAIRAAGGTPEQTQSALLHEIQHAIQNREGFATGGDPSKGLDNALLESQRLIKQAQALMAKEPNAPKLDELMEQVSTGKIDGPTFEREYERILSSFKHYDDIKRLNEAAGAIMNSPTEAYRRLAGEAEARNVQTRMQWTPEQRRATPPWETLDVPEDELIVRHQQGLAHALEEKPPFDLSPEARAARAREQGYIGPLYHGTVHDEYERLGAGARTQADWDELFARTDINLTGYQGEGIKAFDPARIGSKTDKGWYARGVYTAFDPAHASKYAGRDTPGATVYPLMARIKKPFVYDRILPTTQAAKAATRDKLLNLKGWTDKEREVINHYGELSHILQYSSISSKRLNQVLKKNGFDGVIVNKIHPNEPAMTAMGSEVIAFDPNQMRSIFANFDPERQGSSDLLASLLLGGVGLPLMMQAAQDPEPLP